MSADATHRLLGGLSVLFLIIAVVCFIAAHSVGAIAGIVLVDAIGAAMLASAATMLAAWLVLRGLCELAPTERLPE